MAERSILGRILTSDIARSISRALPELQPGTNAEISLRERAVYGIFSLGYALAIEPNVTREERMQGVLFMSGVRSNEPNHPYQAKMKELYDKALEGIPRDPQAPAAI